MTTPAGEPQCLEVPRFMFDHPQGCQCGISIQCVLPAGHAEPLHADLYHAKDGTATEVRWRRIR